MMGILTYAIASFLLHLVWENAQAPLFSGYESLMQHFWICLWATITGDMIFMGVIYTTIAITHRSVSWIGNERFFHHPATWFISLFTGVLLAVGFELWAVHVDHRWVYHGMPLIPVLNVGVFPILQMVVVPFLVLCLSWWFACIRKCGGGLSRLH